ncbi:MAG: hypothetical protein KDA79_10005 [Planctomycetaceae bacterium]|nr:hypothetical protein [Planctomycetaceae bacterium]
MNPGSATAPASSVLDRKIGGVCLTFNGQENNAGFPSESGHEWVRLFSRWKYGENWCSPGGSGHLVVAGWLSAELVAGRTLQWPDWLELLIFRQGIELRLPADYKQLGNRMRDLVTRAAVFCGNGG